MLYLVHINRNVKTTRVVSISWGTAAWFIHFLESLLVAW